MTGMASVHCGDVVEERYLLRFCAEHKSTYGIPERTKRGKGGREREAVGHTGSSSFVDRAEASTTTSTKALCHMHVHFDGSSSDLFLEHQTIPQLSHVAAVASIVVSLVHTHPLASSMNAATFHFIATSRGRQRWLGK